MRSPITSLSVLPIEVLDCQQKVPIHYSMRFTPRKKRVVGSVCQWYTADGWQIAQNLLPLTVAGLLVVRANRLVEERLAVVDEAC